MRAQTLKYIFLVSAFNVHTDTSSFYAIYVFVGLRRGDTFELYNGNWSTDSGAKRRHFRRKTAVIGI